MANGTTTITGTTLNKVLHAAEGIAILVSGVFLLMNNQNVVGISLITAGVAGLGYSIAPQSITVTG